MPSTNQTANLGLNSWIGTDKPKRADFVSDNEILDEVIGEHLADTELHFTEADRARWDALVTAGLYFGTGAASYQLTFSSAPKALLVFQSGKALAEWNADGYMMANAGMATPTLRSAGIQLSGNRATLLQSQAAPAAGGTFHNLNKQSAQYAYIAFF